MTRRLVTALAALALVAAACAPGGTPSPTPTMIPAPTGGTTLGPAELRLVLIDQLGPRWYCDPDAYPVGRDEQQSAIERWPQLGVEDGELLRTIAARLGIDLDVEVSDADKLAVWRQWKVAASIDLPVVREGVYRFEYLAQPAPGATEGTRTAGLIDQAGTITIEQRAAAGEPMCPICLARGTQIDTPSGPMAVERLRLGDEVWTLTATGRRVPGTVLALGTATAPPDHRVVRLELADGRSVTASPGHPLADGRPLGSLRVGDLVDGSRVVAAERVSYGGGETYDLVVSGETGWYLSGGIRLASTLRTR